MPTHNGEYGRTNGQAFRLGEAKKSAGAKKDDMTKDEGMNKDNKVGGGNIVAIKHMGRDAEGKAMPPFQVKHEDGSVSKHASHEEMMAHLDQHMGDEMRDEDESSNDGANMDMTDGSKEAIESLLG